MATCAVTRWKRRGSEQQYGGWFGYQRIIDDSETDSDSEAGPGAVRTVPTQRKTRRRMNLSSDLAEEVVPLGRDELRSIQ